MTPDQDLNAVVERFLSAPEADRPAAFSSLVKDLKSAVATGRYADAVEPLRRAILPTLDYTSAQALYRVFTALKPHLPKAKKPTKLAILSNSTTHQLVQFIELFLFAAGVDAEVYEAEYGLLRQEIIDPDSELYRFKPSVVYLAATYRDLGHAPHLAADRAAVDKRLAAEVADWKSLWQTVQERLGCQVLQNNFAPPPWRLVDNHEMRHPGSLGRFIRLVNHAFAEEAPPYVTIHDVDHIAASAGRWTWGDERFFHQAKIFCAPEHLVDYAHSVVSLIAAQLGLAKKCLVLDLDNTLWGGVIGDDGLGGIRLGQGEPESEAFQAFQRYAKGLKERGVILAVCSKNEDHIAREVFEEHTEMVLRLADISCFVANWTDKAANLRSIAKQLNIGLNSLVFADDNPAERSIVRQLVPEVAVPELPADPADYVQAIERHRYFQVVSLGEEDLKRTEFYLANAAREQAEVSSGSVEDFLKSLQMSARMGPVTDASLERTAQLISRSNQFNLTTRRYSAAEVMAKVADPRWITRTVSLADRFGDNGLICVLLARIDGDELVIDTWLMSCRVLKRGVEEFLLNHLVDLAAAAKCKSIRGEYIPTAKNGLVKEHFPKLGFQLIEAAESGHTQWRLSTDNGWTPRTHFIEWSNAHAR